MRRIAYVLALMSCMSLAVMPAIASDYTLGIFGNANMDDIVDEDDIEYASGIIGGSNEATELADADYDGEIDEDDIAQIELIIDGEEKELTILDSVHRAVTLKMPVKRVVSTCMYSDRIILALDGFDRLVGAESGGSGSVDNLHSCVDEMEFAYGGQMIDITKTSNVMSGPPEIAVEVVASLEPDVIFTSSEAPDELEDQTGAPVVVPMPTRTENMTMMEQWSIQIRCIGIVLGKEEEAEDLISFMDEKLALVTDVTSQMDDSEKPRVFYSTSGIASTSGNYDPIELAGGINVAKDVGGSKISEEQIVIWDPDIILIKCHKSNPPSENQYTIDMALSDPLLQDGGVNAVESGAVYYCLSTCRSYPIQRYIPEVMYFAKLFHPEEFEDLDMEKEGNEIMEKFFGEKDIYTRVADDTGYLRDMIENPPEEGNWQNQVITTDA